jgi:hypothetical protein
MPIQIIDGFQLNVAKPIDSRMVTSGTVSRDAIAYKYTGLRVYDTDSKQPYVWDGTNWINENSNTIIITGTTTAGYIPKFTSSSSITNSIIFEEYNGIKIIDGLPTTNTAEYKLEVLGKIKADQFAGSALELYNIPASKLIGSTNPTVITNQPPSGDDIYILAGGASNTEWRKLSSIPPKSMPSPFVKLDQTSNEYFMIFAKAGGVDGYKYYFNADNEDGIKFIPNTTNIPLSSKNTGQLIIPVGTENYPSLAFSRSRNTGIYRPTFNQIGVSINGKERIRISDFGVWVKTASTSEASFKILNTGGRPFLGFYGTNGDSKLGGYIGFASTNAGVTPVSDLIIENLSSDNTKSFSQGTSHFDISNQSSTMKFRHSINLNRFGQIDISGNSANRYGCVITNNNINNGHGLHVKSAGGFETVITRFESGNTDIAYFTNRGLQIISGNEQFPSICFNNNIRTGMYSEFAGNISFTAAGKKVLSMTNKEIRLPKVSDLAFIFGDDTRIEGTTTTNSLEIYRPTAQKNVGICHFYSNFGTTKKPQAYILADGTYQKLSDARQKENVEDISYGLSELEKLRPVSYTWIGSDDKQKSLGFLAQDVEVLFSEIVNTFMSDGVEYKTMSYDGIIPILVKAVQELSNKIKNLESKM